jgi:hypothetical protein
MCDKNGVPLFYSNGVYIEDPKGAPIAGSMYLNPGIHTQQSIDIEEGNNFHYSMIGIPSPDEPDSIYQMYHSNLVLEDGGLLIKQLFRTSVSYEGTRSGEVIELNHELRSDSLTYYMGACRHANGRDWWLANPRQNSDCIFVDLITPTGFVLRDQQCLGLSRHIDETVGAAEFTPDGRKYTSYDNLTGLFIYDFDRVSGSLTNPQVIKLNDGADTLTIFSGLSISSNSRYLYLSNLFYLYQFDLWSNNIEESRVLIAESSPDIPGSSPTWHGELAPDGKIYWSIASNFASFLNIIHEPNQQGLDCSFEFEGVNLEYNNSGTMYQFPNYRLGPLDGSIADTLGIDNVPVADFRWQDLGQLTVDFRNLSHHEPEDHFWDFRDGNTSTTYRPEHTFADTGTYYVCLTVSNEYGEDTFCRDVILTDTSVSTKTEIIENNLVQIFPNPARDHVILKFSEIENYEIRVFDMLGNLVQERNTEALNYQMWVSSLPAGVYSIQIWNQRNEMVVEKIVIQ